jgi:hypothetical protein
MCRQTDINRRIQTDGPKQIDRYIPYGTGRYRQTRRIDRQIQTEGTDRFIQTDR